MKTPKTPKTPDSDLQEWLRGARRFKSKRRTLKLQIRLNLHVGDWIDLAQASVISGRSIESILASGLQNHPEGWRDLISDINGSVAR